MRLTVWNCLLMYHVSCILYTHAPTVCHTPSAWHLIENYGNIATAGNYTTTNTSEINSWTSWELSDGSCCKLLVVIVYVGWLNNFVWIMTYNEHDKGSNKWESNYNLVVSRTFVPWAYKSNKFWFTIREKM